MQETPRNSRNTRRRHVFVLRCWQEEEGSWRYALEPVDGRSTPRRGFATLDALLAYLTATLPRQRDPHTGR